jgi:N-6 DNA Methylase
MPADHELDEHKAWLGYLQPVGLVVSPHALVSKGVVPSRSVAELQERLLAVAAAPSEDGSPRIGSFAAFAEQVLGWPRSQLAGAEGGPPLPELEVALPEHQDVLKPSLVLLDGAGQPQLPVWIWPRGTDLDSSAGVNGWQAAPQAKLERLLREGGLPDPAMGLLCNGESVRLVVAPRGESSGHLTFPLEAMCSVPGRPLLGAMHMLLCIDRLQNVPGDAQLPALLKESRKFQNLVSTQLAEQVLGALWELLRGFQAADAAAQGRILGELSRADPNQIYGGLLTVLLRLVFLLYAEHRGLMPDDPVFRENYSLGGLSERLRADAGRNPDTMDQRYGAWASLLTLFRLVHRGGGHGPFHLPARHGELFDPQRFPFLEGVLVAHDAVERFEAPRVSDGCIRRVLEGLLVLDGERLSYRSLDVEQIGSVYEAMMGFAVERARGHAIAVRPEHLVVDLDALLELPGDERGKKLKELANCDVGKAVADLAKAKTPGEFAAALGRRISPRTPQVMAPGSLYLQPGEERRRSGSHYTPRELTEPIVQTTLRPILEELGLRPTPPQILSLKICDPAMGSGAFLVEACRQLAEHLVRAWETDGGAPKLAPDEEPLLHARRLIAQRCLYGVDKNPFAVSLAKVSLWLVTLARDHAFTFLDHALKHGDSLVGLTRAQIARFDFAPESDDGPLFAEATKAVPTAALLRTRIGADHEGAEEQQRLDLKEADEVVEEARLIGGLACLAFFSAEKPKARRERLEGLRADVHRAGEGEPGLIHQLRARLREARVFEPPLVPFHWEIEFPEVFDRAQAGFNAIVGNPPFAGKNTLKRANGDGYIDWVKLLNVESHGNADLVAHFFRRAFNLLRTGGALGLIATNTIAQGDTRASGLRWICKHGGVIYAAKRRYKWPIPGAAVIVSVVHIAKEKIPCELLLDGKKVGRISAFLFHAGSDDDPVALVANAGRSFIGAYVLGIGFTFDNADKSGQASTLEEMRHLIAANPKSRQRIFPYLGGEELNDSPTHSHHRYVINFGEMAEEEARTGWPELMAILEAKVKPRRLRDNRASYRTYWWQFAEKRADFSAALRDLEAREPLERRRILARSSVSQHAAFAWVPSSTVLSHNVAAFVDGADGFFACVQGRPHEVFSTFFSSSLEDRLGYRPSDCFDPFPFPLDWRTNAALDEAGRGYGTFRARLMVENDEGLTKTYNRFHERDLDSADPKNQSIPRLRDLHAAMDRAVLDAYGWTDLKPTCVFELEYEIDEEEYAGRKKPWRYRWPEEMRDEVLARLLELNKQRAEEERLSGAAAEARQASAGKAAGAKAKKGTGRKGTKPQKGPGLFDQKDE